MSKFSPNFSTVSADKIFYALTMFPYPSGVGLHAGHASVFTINDVIARYKRMKWYTVFNPFGFDAFGLPTENYALQQHKWAREVTDINKAMFLDQVKALDISFDYDRIVDTSMPDYYKWTQWIFTKLMEAGLVYREEKFVNRCPEDQTVLANDQVVDGKCERCKSEIIQKKHMQWFIKITDYADRLISDLDFIDRPEETKTHQKNWIWRSEGMLFTAKVKDMDLKIQTFSAHFEACYADTFVVIAPEHDLVKELVKWQPNEQEVNKFCTYIMDQRRDAWHEWYKEIEGIFTGRYIEDPLWNWDLPIWVASFALADYGTGIVKCSAHDERDFEFAKKYNIPLKTVLLPEDSDLREEVIKQEICFSDMNNGYLTEPQEFAWKQGKNIRKEMIEYLERKWFAEKKISYKLRDRSVSRQRYRGSPIPVYYTFEDNKAVTLLEYKEGNKKFQPWKPVVTRNVIQCIVKDIATDQYIFLKWKHDNDVTAFFWWIEDNETPEQAVIRELKEEWWFTEVSSIRPIVDYHLKFYHPTKNRNQYSICTTLYAEVNTSQQIDRSEEEKKLADIISLTSEEFFQSSNNDTTIFAMNILLDKEQTISSSTTDFYNAYNPHPDKSQRIPHPIPESELPVLLPLDVTDFKPKGKSPLEDHPTFKYYEKDGKTYLRECDTLDTFMCSSFYFLRYPDAHNNDALIRKEFADKCLPVDFYSGGKEHTVGHLLYSRFIHKFLYDQGYVSSPEPFQKLVHQGMVLGADGRKMGKRYNNGVDPLEIIDQYGTDAVRTYLMFMGPIEQDKIRNDGALNGTKKFLDRVYKIPDQTRFKKEDKDVIATIHETIQKVTEDIEAYKFNTAISKIMIAVNTIYEHEAIDTQSLWYLAQLLAPFAPATAAYLWKEAGQESDIDFSARPVADTSKITLKAINFPIQINGKMRGTLTVPAGISEQELMEKVLANDDFTKHLTGTTKKVIFVADKIMNIINN